MTIVKNKSIKIYSLGLKIINDENKQNLIASNRSEET